MRFVRHSVEGQHNSWDLVNPCLGGGSFEQTSAEHIVEGPMAPFVDGIAFRVVGGSKNPLDSKGAQQLGPNGADEFPAAVGEESTRGAEVGDHMAHEGFADRIGGVIAGWDEDGVFGVAIHEYDQEFMAVVRRQRSHNVNGQRIPGTLRLDSAGRFLAMAVVGAQLTLGTTLSGFEADAAASLVGIPVAEELPQRMPT